MSAHAIEITESDELRLRQLLACLAKRPGTDREARELLRHTLDHAHIVSASQVGRRVVTLQSRAVVEDDETWELMTYPLVHPDHVPQDAEALSILSPLGMAIFGHQEGDFVEWGRPDGTARIWIRKVVYQPEAAGHEHLKYSARRTDKAFRIPRRRTASTSSYRGRWSSLRERIAS